MAKTGLTFYKAETTRFRDRKIRKLVKNFGCAGFAVYEFLLSEIYGDQGCFVAWDEDTVFDVAEYFGIKESRVIEIVNYCAAVGLYDKELLRCGRILTSRAIQERYIEACIVMKRKNIGIPAVARIPEDSNKIPEETIKILEETEKFRNLAHETNVTQPNVTQPNVTAREVCFPFADDSPTMGVVRDTVSDSELISAIQAWIRQMYDAGKRVDVVAMGLHLKDLVAISTNSTIQREAVNAAIQGEWKRFYDPRKPKSQTDGKKNAVGDISGKNYDRDFVTGEKIR